MKKIKLFFVTLFTFYVLRFTYYVTPVSAQVINPVIQNGAHQTTDPKGYFNGVFSAIISIFFIVGIIYYVWHVVFAGYHLIASEGDPKRWESSKLELIYATVGLFTVFAIFAVLKFVGTVLGITGLENLTISWPTL